MDKTPDQIAALIRRLIRWDALPQGALSPDERAYYHGLLFMDDHALASAVIGALEARPELFPGAATQLRSLEVRRDRGQLLLALHRYLQTLTARVGDLMLQQRGECAREALSIIQAAEDQIRGATHPPAQAWFRLAQLQPAIALLRRRPGHKEVRPRPLRPHEVRHRVAALLGAYLRAR